MKVASVTSSNIRTIGHEGSTLYILFNSGTSYIYESVPPLIFDEMVKAESVGQFFHHNIKGKFQHTRLAYDPFAIRAAAKRLDSR